MKRETRYSEEKKYVMNVVSDWCTRLAITSGESHTPTQIKKKRSQKTSNSRDHVPGDRDGLLPRQVK